MDDETGSVLQRAWSAASANWKLTFSFIASSIWFLVVVCLLVVWHNGTIALIALVGTACGWAAGILLAPYDTEEKRFKTISKAVSGIIGGYLLGKFDRMFDLVTDKTSGPPLILNPSFVRAGLIGFGCFLVAAITVFVARVYWQAVE